MAKKGRTAGTTTARIRKAGAPGNVAAVAARLLMQGAGDSFAHPATTARARGAATARAVGTKPVVFACSNPNCIVGITSGSINIVFTGTGGTMMPTGSFPIFWRVQGSGHFTLTVQSGGTLSSPIDSTAPDAGARTLTVPE